MLIMIKFFYYFWIFYVVQAINRDVNTNCGGNNSDSGLQGIISSPLFGIRDYQPDTECTWTISVPSGMVIQLDFQSIDIEEESQCAYDGVILYDKTHVMIANISNYSNNSKYLGNTRFCGSDDYPLMISRTNEVGVLFYSDSDSEGGGFELRWTAIPEPGSNVFNCTFEQGLCNGWTNVASPRDQFNWIFYQRNTPTEETGPTNDHTVQNKNGKYLYIETSLPQKDNDIAILESPPVVFKADQSFACLSFWYHMYGETVDKLLVAKNAAELPVWWMKSGQQKNQWLHAKVQLQQSASQQFRVLFIGIKGPGYKGDIAIDDVTITPEPCIGNFDNNIEGDPLAKFRLTNSSSDQDLVQPPLPTDLICAAALYRCISGSMCIPRLFLCDGHNDCPEHDDEFNCPATTTKIKTDGAMNGGSETGSRPTSSDDDAREPAFNTDASRSTTEQPPQDASQYGKETHKNRTSADSASSHNLHRSPTTATSAHNASPTGRILGQRPVYLIPSLLGPAYFEGLSRRRSSLAQMQTSKPSTLTDHHEKLANSTRSLANINSDSTFEHESSNRRFSTKQKSTTTLANEKDNMDAYPTVSSKINDQTTTSGTRTCHCHINVQLVANFVLICMLGHWIS